MAPRRTVSSTRNEGENSGGVVQAMQAIAQAMTQQANIAVQQAEAKAQRETERA